MHQHGRSTSSLQQIASPTSTSNSTTSTVSSSTSSSSRHTNMPSQFVFKKPLYNHHYHQTHFHHHAPPSPPSTISPTNTHHSQTSDQRNKDLFLAWSDLRRFFVHQQSPLSPASPTLETEEQSFANQFKHNISGRYGQWGKAFAAFYFFSAFS